MAAPLLNERFLGGFAWFVEKGTIVDAQTVSHLIKPDMVPTTNWTDRTLGDILSLKPGNKSEDRTYSRPSNFGGWEDVPKSVIKADWLDLKTRQMGEVLLRLQFGLASPIVEGAAQTPFTKSDRRIEGWLRLQTRQEDGTDMIIMDNWGTLELTAGISADGKVSEPEIRFTVIKSVGGVTVAGNSIVFPAA